MQSLRLKILILTNLICFGVFGQQYNFVKIIPGQGIVFNKDSIILGKTSIKEVCRIFKIRENSNAISNETEWTGFEGKTGGPSYGSSKDIIYRSLTFTFASEKGRDFELASIEAKEDKSLMVYTNNGLMIGMINPKINELFPKLKKQDFIAENKLEYQLFSFGISLQMEKLPNDDFRLTEISIYRKQKKTAYNSKLPASRVSALAG